ncbi:cytochrome c biogenesis CcdA family protein [Patescibacteria group bacterium]
MVDVSYPIAFAAGLISFFAPCVIPLLPAYVGYVTGVSVRDLQDKGYSIFRKKILITSLLYVLGFSIVFVLLGTAAASVGVYLRRYSDLIQRAGGLIIIILGLEFAGFLKIPFLAQTKQFQMPNWTSKLGYFRAFFVGLVFATAWTPCVGAVLGSILTLAAVTGTVFQGATLLFVYSLGISLPFLIVSLTLASAPKYLGFITKHIGVISKVAGIILIVLGLLLLTDTYKYINSWLFETAFSFGYEIK